MTGAPPVPTVELHRHFEAGLSPETVARLATRNGIATARTRSGRPVDGVDPRDPDAVRRWYDGIAAGFTAPDGFARFVDSFGLVLDVLRTLDDLEEAVIEQLREQAAAGSLHTELRGSPFTYRERIDAPLADIAAALVRGVERAFAEHGASGTFLLSFSRQKGLAGDDAPEAARQAPVVARLAAGLHRPDRPVGLDLAGFPEVPFPPRMFAEALAPAREAGVPISIHSGEQGRPPGYDDAPPELAREAIELLGARRIGHGTSLAASPGLRALVRERGIGIESCPLSNLRMGFERLETHPIRLFLDEGLAVSFSTDDPLMFGPMSVAATMDAVAAELPLSRADRVALARHGIATAFVTDDRRSALARRLESAIAP